MLGSDSRVDPVKFGHTKIWAPPSDLEVEAAAVAAEASDSIIGCSESSFRLVDHRDL